MSAELADSPVRSSSAAETEALGESLADRLAPGDVVLIEGELGAGKTTLVRGICRGLGVSERVTSPTYTIGQTYARPGGKVAHLDLYRLEGLAGEDPALLDDYLTPDAITLVEWPAAGGEELRERARIVIAIAHLDPGSREVSIQPGPGPRSW